MSNDKNTLNRMKELSENENDSDNGDLVKPETNDSEKKPKEIFKRGIVYLSFIPPGMTPTLLRNVLSKYAPVGRLYLQEVKENEGRAKKKENKCKNKYTEAWVEFLKKRHAKRVAELLNNSRIDGKKRGKFYDYLWNMKYLSRFKWVHLVERLNFEANLLRQRMRNEISQAKKIASHFKDNVDREERIRRKSKRKDVEIDLSEDTKDVQKRFPQKDTKKAVKSKRKNQESRDDFLKSLFS